MQKTKVPTICKCALYERILYKTPKETTMTILETMTSTSDSAIYESQFTRVSAVRFITSAPFGHDIEYGLRAILDTNLKPEMTEKEYFYRHDAPLEPGQVVIVPARNAIAVAIVSRVGLESSHFAGLCPTARSTMKKVLAALLWSPALYNLAVARRDTEIKKAQLAELKQQHKKAQAEYDDLNVRLSNARSKVSVLNNKICAFERKEGF